MSVDNISKRSISLNDREIVYEFVRRRGRRRISLSIEPRIGLRVLAPPRARLKDVESFIRHERDWLLEKLAALADWEAAHPLRRFRHGDRLPLLGESWRLVVKEEAERRRPRVTRSLADANRAGGEIVMQIAGGRSESEHEQSAARALEAWYRRLARELLGARVDHWARDLAVRPTGIDIRDTRSRWGSCSSRGRLSFCWRIVMAPPPVLDYLVVHELCHLRHPDHSPRFWKLVASRLPEYEARRSWLVEHGEELYL
jgi:predicted metal-dependent hydrolase